MRKNVQVIFCLAALIVPVPAHAGFTEIMNKFFPKDTAPKPEETLIAPFADPNTHEIVGPQKQVSSASLRVPHRSTRDIGVWAVTSVSNAMSFKVGDTQTQIKDKAAIFDSEGYQQYLAFLTQFAVLQAPDGNAYDLDSFVPQEPVLLNEGEVNGAYRWLFELPVMITYRDPAEHGYNGKPPLIKNFIVRAQVGRVDQGADDEGVLIESWTGRAGPASNARDKN